MKAILVFVVAIAAVVYAEPQCPPEQEVDWEIEQLLEHEDCNKFYKCTFGKPIEYNCYGDLYFNLETWQCDWPENVDCTGRNDPALTTGAPTTTITTPAPTTTSTTTTTTTPVPTTTTTTTTTPAPTTTTTTTTTPAPTTTTTTTTTPAPTTTTTTTTTPAPTTTSTTTTPAPTTTQRNECEVEIDPTPAPPAPGPDGPEGPDQPTEFLPNGCPVDPHIHWLLPHETDCNLFYYCVWGELVLRECPSGLYFNPVLQVCDWPQDAGCTVSVNKHAEVRRNLLRKILS